MSLVFSDLPPSPNDNTYDTHTHPPIPCVQFQKHPEHFQWEGNVDVSAEMPEIFWPERGQRWVELSHGKVINFEKKNPPPYFDRRKDNEGHVEQC